MPTYFAGSKDQQTPILAPGTQDYSAVYPPEYQKQAWQWEEDRRAAEREREMMNQMGGPENFAQAQKAIAAAEQMQARRQMDKELSEGKPLPEVLGRWGSSLLGGNPAATANLFKSLLPKGQATTEEVMFGDRKMVKTTQPNGFVSWKDVVPIKVPKDETEDALQKEVATAKAVVKKAATDAGTYNKGTPVVSKGFLGGLRDFVGLPTTTTTNIDYPEPEKMALTQNKLLSAQEQLAASEKALAAYADSKKARSVVPGTPTGAGVVAPPQTSVPQRPTKPLTKEALMEARRATGGDKAAAQQWLHDNGYSL